MTTRFRFLDENGYVHGTTDGEVTVQYNADGTMSTLTIGDSPAAVVVERSIDQITTGNQRDRIYVRDDVDGVNTGDGNDLVRIYTVQDVTIATDRGDDRIVGFDGNEFIIDFHGSNMITTGAGDDRIWLSNITDGENLITDFELGADTFIFNRTLGNQAMSTAEDFLAAIAEIEAGAQPGINVYVGSLGDSYSIDGDDLTFSLSDGGSTTFAGIVDDLMIA